MNFWMEWLVGSMAAGIWACAICFYVLLVIAWWKIFTKAGVEGWMALVPFLNLYQIYKIAWGEGWYFLLMLIPFVGWVIEIIKTVINIIYLPIIAFFILLIYIFPSYFSHSTFDVTINIIPFFVIYVNLLCLLLKKEATLCCVAFLLLLLSFGVFLSSFFSISL